MTEGPGCPYVMATCVKEPNPAGQRDRRGGCSWLARSRATPEPLPPKARYSFFPGVLLATGGKVALQEPVGKLASLTTGTQVVCLE